MTSPYAFHLLSLNSSRSSFLSTLSKSSFRPLIVAEVAGWLGPPHNKSRAVASSDWDILLVYDAQQASLPTDLRASIRTDCAVRANIPDAVLADFPATNRRLLHPPAGSVPPLTGALDEPRVVDDALELNLTPALEAWIRDFAAADAGKRPISVLNLIRCHEGQRPKLYEYFQVFAESVGARVGGVGKLIGTTDAEDAAADGWEDVGLVHYPSIWHFADLVASEGYRECDRKYKQGVTEDHGLLCVTEVELDA